MGVSGMKRHPDDVIRAEGFTLIELLVAMGIFSIVIGVIYGAYSATFRTIGNAESLMDVSARVQTFFDRITEDLELVYQGENSYFEGTEGGVDRQRADSLIMISSAELQLSREQKYGDLVQLVYFARKNEKTGLLDVYRAETPFQTDEDVDYEERALLLCEGVKAFSLTYTDSEQTEVSAWKTGNRDGASGFSTETEAVYPVLVNISLLFGLSDTDENDTIYKTSVSLNW